MEARSRVKQGGLIAGHDYRPGVYDGVVDAVHEFFGDRVHVEPHYVWWVENNQEEEEE